MYQYTYKMTTITGINQFNTGPITETITMPKTIITGINSLYGYSGNQLTDTLSCSNITFTGDYKYTFKIDNATLCDEKLIDIIKRLTDKIDKLEKELNDIKLMIEYSPDNSEKMDELKKDFNELANKMT